MKLIQKKLHHVLWNNFILAFDILEIRTKFVFGYTQNIYLSKNNHTILFIWFLCLPRTLIVFGKKYYMWVGWQNLSFCNMIFNTFYWHFPVPSSFGVFWYKPFFLKKNLHPDQITTPQKLNKIRWFSKTSKRKWGLT